MKGNVKWFNNKKGYGFIIGEDGNEYFTHYTNIVGEGYRSLGENDAVEFEVEQNEKGSYAQNVTHVTA